LRRLTGEEKLGVGISRKIQLSVTPNSPIRCFLDHRECLDYVVADSGFAWSVQLRNTKPTGVYGRLNRRQMLKGMSYQSRDHSKYNNCTLRGSMILTERMAPRHESTPDMNGPRHQTAGHPTYIPPSSIPTILPPH
jgi:hypothetical protein